LGISACWSQAIETFCSIGGNLVYNAIKHGPEAGRVTVDVRQVAGPPLRSPMKPGIPATRSKCIKRFYRLDEASIRQRSWAEPVVGGGARLHGAQIETLDNAPGLTIRLWFPASERSGIENAAAS